jgi:hypothetical protein
MILVEDGGLIWKCRRVEDLRGEDVEGVEGWEGRDVQEKV